MIIITCISFKFLQ